MASPLSDPIVGWHLRGLETAMCQIHMYVHVYTTQCITGTCKGEGESLCISQDTSSVLWPKMASNQQTWHSTLLIIAYPVTNLKSRCLKLKLSIVDRNEFV